jgi:thymidylate synthase
MQIQADTLDDALQIAFKRLLRSPNRTRSTKNPARELIGAHITLKNPRARFSLAEGRSTLFTCLGETLWYFSGSDRLDFIEYYIKDYRTFSELPADAIVAPGA